MVNVNKQTLPKSALIIALEKKYTNYCPSNFIMWHRAVRRMLKPKLIWDSSNGNTYVRAKHGKIGA